MNTKSKIVKPATLKRKIARFHQQGKAIVFTNGCFDILHYGHVNYLQKIKKHDRIFIVGLNSDKSVRQIKGSKRPIVPEAQRAGVLAALQCIDYIVLFDEDTPFNLISTLKPDILAKGADWKDKGIVGADIVKANGGKVELIEYVSNLSTTNIIAKIKRQCLT